MGWRSVATERDWGWHPSFLLAWEIGEMAMPLPEEGDTEGRERWMGGWYLTLAWTAEMPVGLLVRRLSS